MKKLLLNGKKIGQFNSVFGDLIIKINSQLEKGRGSKSRPFSRSYTDSLWSSCVCIVQKFCINIIFVCCVILYDKIISRHNLFIQDV